MPKILARTLAAAAAIAGAQCVVGYQAFAAEEHKTPQQEEIDRLKAETERYKEEANLIKARADRDKARIDALHLPKFEGKTELSGTNAGAMEANMLAMYALQAAAVKISAAAPSTGDVIVLAGDESVDLTRVEMIKAEMGGIGEQLLAAIGAEEDRTSRLMSVSPTLIIEAATAVAGMLQSEVTITAVDLASVSERALAHAVAGKLGERGYLPSALAGKIDAQDELLVALEELGRLRRKAAAALAHEAPNSVKAVALGAAIKRYDDFNARIRTPDDKGVVPIVHAVRLNRLFGSSPKVLRVYVDKAGGTFIKTKNIRTMFGADPLRVTGALIASYTVTEPDTAKVLSSNIYVCRTSLSRLRHIHDADWAGAGGIGRGLCTPMDPGTPPPDRRVAGSRRAGRGS